MTSLRSFIGMCKYLRRYLKDCVKHCMKLNNELLCNDSDSMAADPAVGDGKEMSMFRKASKLAVKKTRSTPRGDGQVTHDWLLKHGAKQHKHQADHRCLTSD